MTPQQQEVHRRLLKTLPIQLHLCRDDCPTQQKGGRPSNGVIIGNRRFTSLSSAARALKKYPNYIKRMIQQGQARHG